MRWEGLFDDLEGQAEALAVAQRAGEVETRTRGEAGTLTVADRLRTAVGTELTLRAGGGVAVRGTVGRVGADWLLVDEAGGREVVVALAHLVSVRGLGRYTAVPGTAGVVESRLSLRHALRGIARDRSAVRIHLAGIGGVPGSAAAAEAGGGHVLDATIDRVGADFIEVAAHAAGEPRRRSDVREVELIPLVAVVAVRRSA